MLIVKQIWDGAIDPFIGILSDNLNTRFGRRKPWIFTFLLPAAALWIAMWASPSFVDSNLSKVGYYGAAILLFSTFASFVFVPYESMVPDMSESYHSRTFVVMFMQIFLFVGTGAASITWSYLVDNLPFGEEEPDIRQGFFLAGCFMAIPIVVTVFISTITSKERKMTEQQNENDEEPKKGKLQFVKSQAISVKQVLTFIPFLSILLFSVLSLVAASIFSNNLILWLKYVYKRPDIIGRSLLILQASIVVFLIIWGIVSRFIGKILTYLIGSLFVIAGLSVIYTITAETEVWIFYLALVLGAIGIASNYLVVNAILPDVIAMNESLYSIRREAVFYSIYGFAGKIAQGIAQLAASYTLGYYGYLNPRQQTQQGVQPPEVLVVLTVFVSLLPLVLRVIGMIVSIVYQVIARHYKKKILAKQEALPIKSMEKL